MKQTIAPDSSIISIPEFLTEEVIPSFSIETLSDAYKFFINNGYVVFRKVVDKEITSQILLSFEKDIKNNTNGAPRISGLIEKNIFNQHGQIVNPVMNAHLSSDKSISNYVNNIISILKNQSILTIISKLIKSRNIKLLTWNHFESNPVTIAHQDCFFWGQNLDVGDIVGCWIALEDINVDAGRLYLYSDSHEFDMHEFAKNQDRKKFHPGDAFYRSLVIELIKSKKLKCISPVMEEGDIIFWDSRTIHGSLPTINASFSRSSITAHFTTKSNNIFNFLHKKNDKFLYLHLDKKLFFKHLIRNYFPFIVELYNKLK